MQSAKSLRKLRSATTAYLEDGSALIHNIDTLIRDVQRAIQDLDARENSLNEREERLNEREAKLEVLNDRIEASYRNCLLRLAVFPQTQASPKQRNPAKHDATAGECPRLANPSDLRLDHESSDILKSDDFTPGASSSLGKASSTLLVNETIVRETPDSDTENPNVVDSDAVVSDQTARVEANRPQHVRRIKKRRRSNR